MQKKNVVFDLGGVLVRFDPQYFAAREGVPPEDIPAFVQEVFKGKEWVAMDRGTMDCPEAVVSICSRLPERLHPAAERLVCGWWKPAREPMPGMAELIQELKALGYGIYLLSNASQHFYEYFPGIPGSQFFDGLVVSADYKLLKPHREIFTVLYQTYGLNPSECVFIDDTASNVDGAEQTGMDGIVFHGNVPRLRKQLMDLGIPVCQEPEVPWV